MFHDYLFDSILFSQLCILLLQCDLLASVELFLMGLYDILFGDILTRIVADDSDLLVASAPTIDINRQEMLDSDALDRVDINRYLPYELKVYPENCRK